MFKNTADRIHSYFRKASVSVANAEPKIRIGNGDMSIARSLFTTITAADFNGDGTLDLAVPHRDGGQSHIYLNDGSGGFQERMPFGPPDAV